MKIIKIFKTALIYSWDPILHLWTGAALWYLFQWWGVLFGVLWIFAIELTLAALKNRRKDEIDG